MTEDCPENHADWADYKANYCPSCGQELDREQLMQQELPRNHD